MSFPSEFLETVGHDELLAYDISSDGSRVMNFDLPISPPKLKGEAP